MVKTPERDNQTPEKEGIEEETETQEKTTYGNTIMDLSDVPGEKQDTPRKETKGNGEEDDCIPTPKEGP